MTGTVDGKILTNYNSKIQYETITRTEDLNYSTLSLITKVRKTCLEGLEKKVSLLIAEEWGSVKQATGNETKLYAVKI